MSKSDKWILFLFLSAVFFLLVILPFLKYFAAKEVGEFYEPPRQESQPPKQQNQELEYPPEGQEVPEPLKFA